MRPVLQFISSLRLTVLLLSASLLLVFLGTLEQVDAGVFHVQQKYFEHVFAVWSYPPAWPGSGLLSWLQVPLPGGYLLGPLLVINLVGAHLRYFQPRWSKVGIVFIHGGVVLLLLGQLWTQIAQKEFFMWLAEGERSNYIESFHYDELALVDVTDTEEHVVYTWPFASLLGRPLTVLSVPDLPLTLHVKNPVRNAAIFPQPPMAQAQAGFPPPMATEGIGAAEKLLVLPQRPSLKDDQRNVSAAHVEVRSAEGSLGTWLVANIFRERPPTQRAFPRQRFTHEGRTYELALRFTRAYLPDYVELKDFRHDRYPGTDMPYNFSSDVRIISPTTGAERDSLIYMNHPLRHAGLTFYQASFLPGDQVSMFQVVRNPARWLPYVASGIISFGLLLQFLISFNKHARRQRPANPSGAEVRA